MELWSVPVPMRCLMPGAGVALELSPALLLAEAVGCPPACGAAVVDAMGSLPPMLHPDSSQLNRNVMHI